MQIIFIKDPNVSSCILAVLSISSYAYERLVRKSRYVIGKDGKIAKDVNGKAIKNKEKVWKDFEGAKFTVINGNSGKKGTRYFTTEQLSRQKTLSDEEVISLFSKQCSQFKKALNLEYIELTKNKPQK